MLGFGQIKLFCPGVKQVRRKNISSQLLSTKTRITIESMAKVSYSLQMQLPFEWLSGRIYSHFFDRQPTVNKEGESKKFSFKLVKQYVDGQTNSKHR